MEIKKWYHSKTMIVMGVALLATIVSGIVGEDWLDGEVQVSIVTIIGLVLRLVTKQGLS